MNILDLFLSDEQRNRIKVRQDNARKLFWTKEADRIVQSQLIGTQLWVSIKGIPVFRVTNESDIRSNTISVADVDRFIATIKDSFINAHQNTPLPTKYER